MLWKKGCFYRVICNDTHFFLYLEKKYDYD